LVILVFFCADCQQVEEAEVFPTRPIEPAFPVGKGDQGPRAAGMTVTSLGLSVRWDQPGKRGCDSVSRSVKSTAGNLH